jgi:transketolase
MAGDLMRDTFYATTHALLDDDPRTALVLADISAAGFVRAARAHPDRVINVGIREALMVSLAGGLALTGLRPIVHSYAPFVIERAWEQIKLDLDHQGVGAILVSVGASYDGSEYGRTHFSPGDVSLLDTLDTLDHWTIHVPGHAAEVAPLLRRAARHDRSVYIRLSARGNARPHFNARSHDDGSHDDDGRLQPMRRGSGGVVVAVGPMLDRVLAATEGLDVTVAYTHTPRPFDADGLRELVWHASAPAGRGAAVVVVEPYLAGTSARVVAEALVDVPHRLLGLGVGRADLHRYGSAADHDVAHGLDPAALRTAIAGHL